MAKKIVFAWGRFNPPTTGHGVVMGRVEKEARSRNADYSIFASKTNDPMKNPLTFKMKIKFLKASFPSHSKNINSSPRLKTVIDVMKFLDKKYQEVSLVVGADRAKEFDKLLNHYNGREYDFDNIEIISAGERDPDAEDVTGMSASKMRKAASEGDYSSFKKGSPMKNPKPLYDAIRRGMKINEEFCRLVEEVHGVSEEESHDVSDRSVFGRRFTTMLRFGLVKTKDIPITIRAFKDLEMSAPNAQLRQHVMDVTDKVLEYIMADDLLYRRMLLLLHDEFLMSEDHRDGLVKKAQRSGIQYTALLEVFLRGLAASPIYGTKTAHQYAFERVNSFVSGGKSRKRMDSDIWEMCQIPSQTTAGRKTMKSLSESSPPKWGTKEMADRYNKVTPGQPDDTSDIKQLIQWVSSLDDITEVAPPGSDAETFIKLSKDKFKERYGDKWEKVLYATAWKKYGNNESVIDEASASERSERDKAHKEKMTNIRAKISAAKQRTADLKHNTKFVNTERKRIVGKNKTAAFMKAQMAKEKGVTKEDHVQEIAPAIALAGRGALAIAKSKTGRKVVTTLGMKARDKYKKRKKKNEEVEIDETLVSKKVRVGSGGASFAGIEPGAKGQPEFWWQEAGGMRKGDKNTYVGPTAKKKFLAHLAGATDKAIASKILKQLTKESMGFVVDATLRFDDTGIINENKKFQNIRGMSEAVSLNEELKLPPKMDKVRMPTMYIMLQTAVIKKESSLPGSAPLGAQLLKSLTAIAKELKPKMTLTGKPAVVAFLTAAQKHFNTGFEPLGSMARKYKLPVDRTTSKVDLKKLKSDKDSD